jgi:hypothetical protein
MAEVLPFNFKSSITTKAEIKLKEHECHAFANALDVSGKANRQI